MKIKHLLKEYRSNERANNPQKLEFKDYDDKDIYNITAPVEYDGKTVIFARVESRDSELSQTVAFELIENEYKPITEFNPIAMQDPFVSVIEGELILGGVSVFPKQIGTGLDWKTVFYKVSGLNQVSLFFEGPIGMKDIRLAQLNDRRILVLTRPQGDIGGRGKIGATIIDKLDDLTIEVIEQAPLLANQFKDDEWGGANDMYVLSDNQIGVLGHIANFDDKGNRHYYPMTFELDIETLKIDNIQIIAERTDFLPGPAKREDLIDVIFSGGLIKEDDKACLYAGTSDAEAQSIEINWPFKGGRV